MRTYAMDVEAPGDDFSPVSVLSPDGSFHPHPLMPDPLGEADLRRLHRNMVVTRRLDQELINLQRQGELALFPSCRGQEAAQVGPAFALRDTDWLFPQYRELGFFVARGVDPVGIAHLWRGSVHGGYDLLEHHCAPLSVPIGTQALHAVGMAMGCSLDGSTDAAVACIGDGATSTGDVHAALNFAAVFESPCVFWVQNNAWAISVPIAEQTRAPSIAHKAVGYGIPGIRCDGNDVLACLAAMRWALEHARSSGPVLVEAVTYRMGAHTTADDPGRYRDADELAEWLLLDPLTRLEAHIRLSGASSEEHETAVAETADAAAARLRAAVVGSPDPDPALGFTHVFEAPTPQLLAQAEEMRSRLAAAG